MCVSGFIKYKIAKKKRRRIEGTTLVIMPQAQQRKKLTKADESSDSV